ncbi:MAG: sigma-70 family RNA polymerase sigma factor [Chloroflexota bacterium]
MVPEAREDEDARLVAQAARGDPQSFRRLIEKYQDLIYDLCLRMLGNPQDAEDVAQETFLTLHRCLGGYRKGGKLSNWLYTVAINRCRSRLRKRRILRFFSLDSGAEDAEDAPRLEPPSLEAPLDAALARAEAERWAQRLVDSLPDPLKAPFVLRHLKEMSYEEISDALELPVSNVKVRLHRAKLFLWKRFGKAPEGM